MGNYTIVISGTGQHHNGMPEDADALTRDTVNRLINAGHSIESASICAGGREDLMPGPNEATEPDQVETEGTEDALEDTSTEEGGPGDGSE